MSIPPKEYFTRVPKPVVFDNQGIIPKKCYPEIAERFKHFNKGIQEEFYKTCNYFDIQKQVWFLANLLHESLRFTKFEENLNYSGQALHRIFRKYFPTLEDTKMYAFYPRKIANRVYGGRMGNNTKDDGWKYRGRGAIQLTGRHNYIRYHNFLLRRGLYSKHNSQNSFVNLNPHLVALPGHRIFCGGWFWYSENLDRLKTFKKVVYKINGGYNGLEDRKECLAAINRILGKHHLERSAIPKHFAKIPKDTKKDALLLSIGLILILILVYLLWKFP